MNPVAWFRKAVGVALAMIHVQPSKPTRTLSLEATSAFKRLKLAWIGLILDVSCCFLTF